MPRAAQTDQGGHVVRATWLIVLALASYAVTPAGAEEGTVTFHDPSCGFFVLKLPGEEGYGLYQWQSGPTPTPGQVMEGDLIAGEHIEVTNKTAGGTNRLVHWANAPTPEVLVGNMPFQCTSRWNRMR
jgi:hypothetical protein